MKNTRKCKNPTRIRNRENRDPLKSLQVKNKMVVAARIDDIRLELSLLKSGFAELVGQKPSVITKWLSGTHNFTQDTYTLIEYKTGKKIYEEAKKEHNSKNVSLKVSYSELSSIDLNKVDLPVTPSFNHSTLLRKFAYNA